MTDDLGPDNRDDLYGYGLINARNAVANASLDPQAPSPPGTARDLRQAILKGIQNAAAE